MRRARHTTVVGVLAAALVLAGAGPATAAGADVAGPDSPVVTTFTEPETEATQAQVQAAADAQAVGSTLSVGQALGPGQSLVSASGRYTLVMSEDGELLVALQPTRFNPEPVVLFGLGLGDPGASLRLQRDGNLVLYDADGSVAENYATAGSGADRLVMQDDRNVVLYAGNRVIIDFDTRTLPFMVPGQALLSGDRLLSPDGSSLVMQTDGNLVLYRAGRVLFQSRTGSTANAGADAVLQEDGNFVVYAGSRAVFDTRTGSRASDLIGLLDLNAGAFRVSQSQGAMFSVVYGSAWGSASLTPGQSLVPGDRRRSADGRNVLRMQTDGNLVQYRDGRAVFSTRTSGESYAVMQSDGNFVLYGYDLVRDRVTVPFQTRTNGNAGAALVLPNGTAQFQVRSTTGRVLYPR